MFSNPDNNVQQLKLDRGMSVADIGSGIGAYSLAAAKRIGDGKVYAIDVQKELLERLQKEAEEQGINNIEIVWGDAEEHQGTRLRDASIDIAIIANTLFQMANKAGLAKETFRILKMGGQVLVVDWSESFGGLGPQPNQVIVASAAKDIMIHSGFTFERDIEAGAHHYGMIFSKK